MGTCIWETADAPGKIIMDEYAPYNVRMWTTDRAAAAVCLVVPVTDDNRESLARVYDFPAGAACVYVASIIKHDGTLYGKHREGVRRTISAKHMSEDMGPNYTGGANAQFLDILTPLKERPANDDDNLCLAWAHKWRCSAYRAMLAAA